MENLSKNIINKAHTAANYIKRKFPYIPDIAVVTGSGLNDIMSELHDCHTILYEDIPYMPCTSVAGHAGEFVVGKTISGKGIILLKGRIHFYEGHPMADVAFFIRILNILGIKKIILTNAAGGVNLSFKPGDLMLIIDHINLMSDNPLRGYYDTELGDRFPDMTYAYDAELSNIAVRSAKKLGIDLMQGVYVGLSGPCFETPAEIRMIATIGGDAVGMSTIPEVIVARQCQMQVLGISYIANYAAGITKMPLSHADVLETGKQVNEKFSKLLLEIIENI